MKLPILSSVVALTIGTQCHAHENRPEKMNYAQAIVQNPQDRNFAPYWSDQLNSVDWTSPRPVTIFSRYFFNGDGRRLFVTMLSAGGACGVRECPVRMFTETGQQIMEVSACDQADTHEISADRLSLVACGTASPIPQGGPPGSLETTQVRQLSHNGSIVRASFYKNGTVSIAYDEPRKGLPTSLRGVVLFRGAADPHRNLTGTAYTFKNGCNPVPYAVHGKVDRSGDIVLTGDAPVRDGHSCGIVGFTVRSPHSRLTFVEFGDE